jgi:membrane-associated protease RseP (regulator of RpoE activity)
MLVVGNFCNFTAQTRRTRMTTNIGTIDRATRIAAGAVLISLVFVGPQTPWGWIGLVPLFTGLFGYCPAYTLLGIRTSSAEQQHRD